MSETRCARCAELMAELEQERKWHYEQSDKAHEATAALSAERTARETAERDGDRVRVVVLDFLSSHSPQECAGRGECVCDDAWPLVGLPFGAVDQARRTRVRARAALAAEPGEGCLCRGGTRQPYCEHCEPPPEGHPRAAEVKNEG